MNSHDQAVQEVMETFGVTKAEAEEIVDLEEVGFVMDETGAILPDVDPDAPIAIPLEIYQDNDQEHVQWN
jgi:hypothetical protein